MIDIVEKIKKPVMVGFVALALFGGGYATGRHSAPTKVTIQDRVVEKTVYKDRMVIDTESVLKAVRDLKTTNDVAKDVHVKTVTVKAKDGTVTTTVESTDQSKTQKTADTVDTKTEQTKQTVDRIVEKDVVKEHETIKTVERARSRWGLSLMPGFDFAGALGHGTAYSALPTSLFPGSSVLLRHAVIGASIERRLIGPLSTGVWFNSAGVGGVTLRLEF